MNWQSDPEIPDFESARQLLLELAQQRTLQEVLDRVVQRISADRPRVLRAAIWLVDSPDPAESRNPPRELVLASSARKKEGEGTAEWPLGEGDYRRVPCSEALIGRCAADVETILVREPGEWPGGYPDWAGGDGILGCLVSPLRFRERALGVLGMFISERLETDRPLGAREQGALVWTRIFADHIAMAVVNSRAFEEIERLKHRLELENEYLREEVRTAHGFGEIIGTSAALRKSLGQIELVAPTDATVLIQGETGTGKELIARAIHERSERTDRPLIKVNCASVPRDLFESEFFGHVRGAFTGAVQSRRGRFELADGATLFLDEVGEIPVELQSKLLRVIQEGTFERVGDEATRRTDVRLIAATNRDLRGEMEAGRFREDLYYRLSVFPVEIVPLRDRPEDIAPLAEQFLRQACEQFGLPQIRLKRRHVARLEAYDWPGNVRELQNVIQRAAITARSGRLEIDLPTGRVPKRGPTRSRPTLADDGILTEAELRQRERLNLHAALEKCAFKVFGPGGAAELLGIKPTTLVSRMKAMGIERPR